MINNLTVVERNKSDGNYNLNEQQAFATGNILDFIAAPFNPLKYMIGLIGAGGVGKTYVTNYIIDKCIYGFSVITCCSPTHKACRVFSENIGFKEVSTIQKVFGFRLDMRLQDFDPDNPYFSAMGKPKLEGIKLLIIDEASMLPAKLVTYVRNKCKEYNVKVIFIGDNYQHAPVNERRSIAFDVCFAVFELTTMMRQALDNPVTPMLQVLRSDIKNRTYKFIEAVSKRIGKETYNDVGEGFKILRPNDFYQEINKSFSNEEYTKNIDMYRIIGYTNTCVSDYNRYIRNSIIKDANKSIITKNDLIMSYETIVDEFMDVIINNSEEYIINDIVNFVDDIYQFKGYLVKFQLIHGGGITRPLFVIDHRDKFSVMKYHKVVNALKANGAAASKDTRSSKWKEYYAFKKKYLIAANIVDNIGKVLHDRDIDYGFSITSHKAQGSTYGSVFVDLNNLVYDKHGIPYSNQDELLRRVYVACSRTKTELILSFGR